MSAVRVEILLPSTPTAWHDLFGIPVAAVKMEDVLERVEQAVAARQALRIAVINAAKVVNMRRDPGLRRDVLSSDVILADGISVVWASRLLGRPLPERVAGIDLMLAILKRASRSGMRVFFLGAMPEILDRAVAQARIDFPGLEVAGSHHGYFTPGEERAVANRIAASRADVLFVGMTSPRKEQFLARWNRHLGVPVCHGVGGSFDVLAGQVRRAPLAWQRLGLEWLYRVWQEPRRLWRRYLITNTVFCWMLLVEVVRSRRGDAVRSWRPVV